jgi:hypothetical protein
MEALEEQARRDVAEPAKERELCVHGAIASGEVW